MGDRTLDQETDRLYGLPLAEFIGARNELAKELRAAGDRQAADEIKALAKPSMTAWAVNVLFQQERQLFDELLAAAAAVRAALAGKGDRKKADVGRRTALQALLARAAKILGKAGHAATPANRQRISHSLETLAARDPAEDGPRPGRLTRDLEPQGFDVLAGFAASLAAASPAISPSTGAATTSERNDRIAAARSKVDEQQAALARLERDIEEAEATADETVERHERLVEELAKAEQLARAAAEATATAKSDMGAAKAAAARAKAARRRGLSRLATAQRQLARLTG